MACLVWLRFLLLENKPIHHDEAVNAWWLTQISELGFFPYDPTNYHGPLFFYVEWFFSLIFGDELWVLRLVTVIFSALTVLLLYKRNYRWAALVMALSPAFFFFSRSAIHEAPFVFFQVLMFLGFLDWRENKDRGFEIFLIGLLGSLCIKETWALSFISLIVASTSTKTFPRKISLQPVLLVFTAWLIIFTGFFQDFSGALNFFKAFMPWLSTGTGGSGHDKAFIFWLEQMIRYESVIFILILLSIALVWKKKASEKFRFTFIFSLTQLFLYSVIPYKTIWCLIAILWPFCLSADEVFEKTEKKKLLITFITPLVLWQSYWIYKLSFQNPIHFDHPYVYVQTSQELKKFSDQVNPQWSVFVVRKDVWPFPWILRKNQQVRYLTEIPESTENVDVIIADLESSEKMSELLKNWKKQEFFLRDGANEVLIYQRNP